MYIKAASIMGMLVYGGCKFQADTCMGLGEAMNVVGTLVHEGHKCVGDTGTRTPRVLQESMHMGRRGSGSIMGTLVQYMGSRVSWGPWDMSIMEILVCRSEHQSLRDQFMGIQVP